MAEAEGPRKRRKLGDDSRRYSSKRTLTSDVSPNGDPLRTSSRSSRRISRAAKAQLAEDDAIISRLERKLGRRRKAKPQGDGLEELLGGLDENSSNSEVASATGTAQTDPSRHPHPVRQLQRIEDHAKTVSHESKHVKAVSELPNPTATATEVDRLALRKQIRRSLNKLSETTFARTVREIAMAASQHTSAHVSSILHDLLLDTLAESGALNEPFIILHAAFVAATSVYLGIVFMSDLIRGAMYRIELEDAPNGSIDPNQAKKAPNLTTFVSELCNFHVILPSFLFDWVKKYAECLTEMRAELLLRMIRSAGGTLISIDPSSVRDVSDLLSKALARRPEAMISFRTRFMVEMVKELQNGRLRTQRPGVTQQTDLRDRLRKSMKQLRPLNATASEPLDLSFAQARSGTAGLTKQGQLPTLDDDFLTQPVNDLEYHGPSIASGIEHASSSTGDQDLGLTFAREHRMNTDVRRAILTTIISAADYHEAHTRLLNLRLRKAQKIEIPKVLVHCVVSEWQYNPYYAALASQCCTDHPMRTAFNFTLWDLAKRFDADAQYVTLDASEPLKMTAIVNAAKLYAALVAKKRLALTIFKHIDVSSGMHQARLFGEIFWIELFRQIHRRGQKQRLPSKEASAEQLRQVILKTAKVVDELQAIRLFVQGIHHTDLAENEEDLHMIRRSCRVVEETLSRLEHAAEESALPVDRDSS